MFKIIAVRSLQEKPLQRTIVKKNCTVQFQFKFTKEHIKWPKERPHLILWSDEDKTLLFGSGGHWPYVRRLNPSHCSRFFVHLFIIYQGLLISWNTSEYYKRLSGHMPKRKCLWNGCFNSKWVPDKKGWGNGVARLISWPQPHWKHVGCH